MQVIIELNGSMVFGPAEHKTDNRLRNTDDFERYINAIGFEYDSGEFSFTRYVYKLNAPQFNVVKRSAYAIGTNYMKIIVENKGQNC